MKITIGTQIHCNRCNRPFALDKDMERGPFGGSRAARLASFTVCPHCGMNDAHWLFAADAGMPSFSGGFDARKRAERRWLDEN